MSAADIANAAAPTEGAAQTKVVTTPEQHQAFMREAVNLSFNNMRAGLGGPFGCVIVRDNEIIATGINSVLGNNDPTAHAEVVAIRNACSSLKTFQLTGCTVYTSCEPCPMCLAAIYWARPDRVFFANSRQDAADIDFDDNFIYEELAVPMSERKIPCEKMDDGDAIKAFQEWSAKTDRTEY